MAQRARLERPDRREVAAGVPDAAVELPGPGLVAAPGLLGGGGAPLGAAEGAVGSAAEGAALRRVADDPLGGTAAAPEVAGLLSASSGAGRPLPADVVGPYSRAVGMDLSPVRVHTDERADVLSRSVQATAFTHGSDVYFRRGAYAPQTDRGSHLLAHELSHVAQNAAGGAGGPLTVGRADDPAEAAADRSADRIVSELRRSADPGAAAKNAAPRGAFDDTLRRTAVLRRAPGDSDDVSGKIANGHSYDKHVEGKGNTNGREFDADNVKSRSDFKGVIKGVIDSGTSKGLTGGRTAYYDGAKNTVVIHNPNASDQGTCFKPTNGKTYFDNLK